MALDPNQVSEEAMVDAGLAQAPISKTALSRTLKAALVASGIFSVAGVGGLAGLQTQITNIGIVSPIQFGADPTCASDASGAWTTMTSVIGPGTTIDVGPNCFLLSNSVTLPDNVSIRGPAGFPDALVYTASAPAPYSPGLKTSPYTWKGQIRTGNGVKISVGNGFHSEGVVYIHAGLSLPATSTASSATLVSQFADTAIYGNNVSMDIVRNAFFGYNYAIYSDNGGGAGLSNKTNVSRNVGDVLRPVYIASSGDTSRVYSNHFFPFLTTGFVGSTASVQSRPGPCLTLYNGDTSSMVFDNLCFGYQVGAQGTAEANVTWLRNHLEAPPGISANAGISVSGEYNHILANWVIGYPYGIHIEAGGSPIAGVTYPAANAQSDVVGNQIISPGASGNYCIDHFSGYALIAQNFCQNGYIGIQIDAGATRGTIRDNDVTGAQFPIYMGAVPATFRILDNPGYNPVGPANVASPPASGGTYTAGSSPETVYMSASNGITTLKQNGLQILPGTPLGTGVMGTFDLGPGETLSPTYSGTLTMTKMVH